MASAFDFSAFDRATDPIFGVLTAEQARAIVDFHGDDGLAQRVEELTRKCNAGELADDERAEYEAYPSANHFIALLQAKAHRLLNGVTASSCDAETMDSEEIAASRRLKTKTPPNSKLLALVQRATVPSEINDVQEERPW
jgi:hypothetical protein